MSLYNMVMGENPAADSLLKILGLSRKGIPRYRDCWLSADGRHIDLLTRTGGANRADYPKEIEALRQVPGYKTDFDDRADPTFMHFVYAVSPSKTGGIAGNDVERGPAFMMKAVDMLKETGFAQPHPNPKIEAIRQGSQAMARKVMNAIEQAEGKPGTIIRINGGNIVDDGHD